MPNAYVTSATITDGKIELTVVVDDFVKYGGYVEVSGEATQTSGAFANFYDIQEVPSEPNLPPDPDGTEHYGVVVSATPIPPKKFTDLEVTTVMRVARVWVTVLGKRGSGAVIQPPDAADLTTWDRINQVSQVGGPVDGPWQPPGGP